MFRAVFEPLPDAGVPTLMNGIPGTPPAVAPFSETERVNGNCEACSAFA